MLRQGAGDDALARFDREVLAVPGVGEVVVLEGINDIGVAFGHDGQPLAAADLIAGYRQLVARAHGNGVKVIMGTIMPFRGAGYYSTKGERVRMAVNAWIRGNREADGFVDFERAVPNPADPSRMSVRFDSGDHLHLNDAGMQAMASAVNLRLLM